ncbi:MAG: DUF4012 domain-containing protein [Actinobacteria bacterium]|nr:DUF4012 domain-containing protein [Actinomycetota bacterium]MCG2801671.1 DUF4012 domain-containing protein [Cellulomonas sp.]
MSSTAGSTPSPGGADDLPHGADPDAPAGSTGDGPSTPEAPRQADPIRHRRPGRGRGRVVRRVVAVALLVLVLAVGWVGFRAYQAGSALQEARSAAARLGDGMLTGDVSAAELATAQRATARAAEASSDPVWRAAEVVPWAGAQLHAVRIVSTSLAAVTDDTVPPLLDLVGAARAGGLRTSDGRFDLTAIAARASALDRADQVAADASTAVDGLSTAGLVGPLVAPVAQVQDVLTTVAATARTASTIVDLAPAMLGADGPRTYLVLALNSAELRSAGGIVGAVTAINVDHGALTLGAQRSTRDLPKLDSPVLPLTDEELAADGDRLGRWIQDATMTPDFPRTGQLVAARWVAAVGGTVDGVVAVDASAVAHLLTVTGPVTTASGQTLTSDTFVAAVLQAPYESTVSTQDAVALDRTFADVAASVFQSLLGAGGDQGALLSAGRTIVDEQRLRIWSAHEDEQSALEPTSVGGAFLSGPFATTVGVFLNDATAGKLDYYLSTSLEVAAADCTSGTATLRLTLSYQPPAGIESSSGYLRGPGLDGVPPGDVATTITFAAGRGDDVGPITQDGTAVGGRSLVLSDRGTQTLTSVLSPGQSVTYQVQVPMHGSRLGVWTTPTITQPGLLVAACSAATADLGTTNG